MSHQCSQVGPCQYFDWTQKIRQRRELAIAIICASLVTRAGRTLAQALPSARLIPDIVINADSARLAPINHIVPSRGGEIAIPQPQDHLIRFFRGGIADGSFGREGSGPGEFRDIELAGWVADTLWVIDESLNRATLIRPGPKLLRTIPVPQPLSLTYKGRGVPAVARLDVLAVQPHDQFIVLARTAPHAALPAGLAGGVGESPVLLISSQGEILRRISSFPADTSCTVASQIGATSLFAPVPFCTRPAYSVDAESRMMAFAVGTEPDNHLAGYRVTIVDLAAKKTISVTGTAEVVPVTRHAVDSFSAIVLNPRMPAPVRDAYRTALPHMTVPKAFQPFLSVYIGTDGSVWLLQRTSRPEDRWLALDSRGKPLFSVQVPRDVMLMDPTLQGAWATRTREDGIDDVVYYRIQR